MKAAEIKNLVERHPFRPFSVRVSDGALYTLSEPRNLGAPKDCHVHVCFGVSDRVLIDTNSITDVIHAR